MDCTSLAEEAPRRTSSPLCRSVRKDDCANCTPHVRTRQGHADGGNCASECVEFPAFVHIKAHQSACVMPICPSWYSLPVISRLIRRFALISVAMLLSCAGARPKNARTAPPIVITHVTVINPGFSSLQRDMTVIVDGDR